MQETIRATVKSYAAGILDKLRELQVDLRATPAIFTGGGAALFRTFIETSSQVAKAEFVADPKANAVGFGMLATAQLRQILQFPQLVQDAGSIAFHCGPNGLLYIIRQDGGTPLNDIGNMVVINLVLPLA